MSGASWIALVITIAAHLACLTVALVAGPSNRHFGVLFLTWLFVPSTVSAIGFAPRWRPVVAAAINGSITALIVDFLLVGLCYFWPLQPGPTQIGLAIVYLLVFPAIASTCGAFVAIVIRAIENAESQAAGVVGTRKGLSFAAVCALLTLPVLLLLLPSQSRMFAVSVGYLVGVLLLGTIVGALTGFSYHVLRRKSQETGAR